MKYNKKLLGLTALSAFILTPTLLVISCSQSNDNQSNDNQSNDNNIEPDKPIVKVPTQIRSSINSKEFNINNLTVNEAVSLFNPQFILDNKKNIFQGDNELNNINQIEQLSSQIQGTSIRISLTLSAGTWYDENGTLGNSLKPFNFTVTDF